jgi:hypothetical protein
MLRRVFGLTLFTLLIASWVSAFGQAEQPPLKVAMLIPIEPWDRKAGLEAFRKWLEDHYRVEVTWIEPAVPQPTKDTPEAERKAYYANPPAIPGLDKAQQADVIFTALTHVQLNEKDSVELLKLLTTKPVVGGRRSHHGMGLKLPKGASIPGIETAGKYGEAIFGGGYAGHHGGTQQLKEGQENHPIVKGLPDLVKFSLYDRGYKHKIVADDVTVLIEMKDSQEPQTWCRINKTTKQRTFYTVHDPVDIEKHESVRVMLARALFWTSERNEADYRK